MPQNDSSDIPIQNFQTDQQEISSTVDSMSSQFEEILNRAVQETGAQSVDPILQQRFQEIAESLPEADFDKDIVLVKLVEAVTESFSILPLTLKTGLNQTIAKTLFDDAKARHRIERLWNSLKTRTAITPASEDRIK